MTSAADLMRRQRFPVDAVVHVPGLEIREAQVKTFRTAQGSEDLVYGLRTPEGRVVSDVPEDELRAGKAIEHV